MSVKVTPVYRCRRCHEYFVGDIVYDTSLTSVDTLNHMCQTIDEGVLRMGVGDLVGVDL